MNNSSNILLYGNNTKQNEGLGWVGVLVSAIAVLVPLVVKAFNENDKDQWSKWDVATQMEYVRQGLKIAVNSVLTGKSQSVEQVMQPIIAKVESDNWMKWSIDNPRAMQLIQQAKTEIANIKQGNFSANYQFVDPMVLQTYKKMNAGFFNGSTTTWVVIIALLTIGIVYKITTNKQLTR